jgi:hypothetical protein
MNDKRTFKRGDRVSTPKGNGIVMGACMAFGCNPYAYSVVLDSQPVMYGMVECSYVGAEEAKEIEQ